MHNCLIKTCLSSTTNSHNSGVTFHSVPPNLAPVYLHLSGRFLETNLQNFIDSGYQQQKICSLHFQKEQYTWHIRKTGLVKQLKSGELPKLYLGITNTQRTPVTINNVASQTDTSSSRPSTVDTCTQTDLQSATLTVATCTQTEGACVSKHNNNNILLQKDSITGGVLSFLKS